MKNTENNIWWFKFYKTVAFPLLLYYTEVHGPNKKISSRIKSDIIERD